MSDEIPKLRLKPRLNLSEPTPASPIAGSAIPAARGSDPTVPPGSTTEPLALSRSPSTPLAVVAVQVEPPAPTETGDMAAVAPASADTSALTFEPTPEQSRRVIRNAWIVGVLGVLAFAAIGSLAYPRLIAQTRALSDAQARLDAAENEEPSDENADESDPGPAGNPGTPLPGRTEAQATKPVSASPKTNETAPMPAPAEPAGTRVAEIAATATEPIAHPPGSFEAWVASVKISGVRGGSSPRILIGGRSYNVNDVVNEELGIVFDRYDAATHLIRFRDGEGRTLERKDR